MNLDKLSELLGYLSSQHYDIKVAWKDESFFMKALSKVLAFNPDFLSSYTTTINKTIYFPSKSWLESQPFSTIEEIVFHECVHVQDSEQYRLGFKVTYLFPQVLGVLALFSWAFPPLLLFLMALLPWPSPFRTYWEKRGYTATLLVRHLRGGVIDDRTKLWLLSNFTSLSYYQMSWDAETITKDFEDIITFVTKTPLEVLAGHPTYGFIVRYFRKV